MAVLYQPQVSDALSFFAGHFGLDDSLCQDVLRTALAHGGDHADLYAQHAQNRYLTIENCIVRGGATVDAGVGVRVIRGEAVGYAVSERFDRESLLAAARTASETAAGGGMTATRVAPLVRFAVDDHYPVASLSLDEPAPVALDLLRRADSAARAVAPSITNVQGRLFEEVKQIVVATSDCRLVGDTQPIVRLTVGTVSVRDGDRQEGYDSRAARAGFDAFNATDWDPEAIGHRASERALLGHDAVDAPAGFLPVVLAAGDSGVYLHEA